jgi:mRNA interferase YafO
MSIIYTHKTLAEERKTNQFLDALLTDFALFKDGKLDASFFGKDVPFHQPMPQAERAMLRHIHILQQIKSIHVGGTSDSFLVYTEASMHANTYYIIDYIASGAHEKARNINYMNWLINMAESFRMKV